MGKQAFFGLRGSALNWLCVLAVTFPTFTCYGYNQSVAGGLLTTTKFLEQFPEIDAHNAEGSEATYKSNIQGTVISLYTAGGIFGALATSAWGDRLGRRNFIFGSTTLVMIGAILMASAYQLPQLIVARVILGLGTGAMSGTVPVWASELAKITNRGSHSSAVGMYLSVGITLGFWIDFALSFAKDSSVSWRFPLAFQLIFCIVPMATIYFLPESPRWLITRGREDEARYILGAVNELDPYGEVLNTEIMEMKESLEIAKSGTMRDLFSMGETRVIHRAGLAFLAMFFSQICAINAITFYANTIFENYLNMTHNVASILSGCMEIIQIIGALGAMITIDRFGRRPLMIFSAIGLCICMALVAGLTSNTNNTAALDVAVVALYALNFIYSVGFAGCCFCYSAEISPLHVRSLVNGFAVGTTWAVNFLVAMVSPTAFNSISWRYYIVWACVNGFMILPLVYFFFPETRLRALEEIDEIFLQSKSFFDTVGIAKRMPYRHNRDGTINNVGNEKGTATPPLHVEERSDESTN